MRDSNWLTNTLSITGICALLWSIGSFQLTSPTLFLLITLIMMVLEMFPIRLLSGDKYTPGTIGYLFLLIHDGLAASMIAVGISLFMLFVNHYRSLWKINWFRFFANCGMYFCCLFTTSFIVIALPDLNLYVLSTLVFFSYEVTNVLVFGCISKALTNTPIFHQFWKKMRELIVPAIVNFNILPRFLYNNEHEMITDILPYTALFVLIIIVLSRRYIDELFHSRSITREFISLLEKRIISNKIGHGTRVGLICEELLQVLDYPKKHKNNLMQLAVIHDIGKSLLPIHVFNKRGALTLSEEKEYQSHAKKGAEVVTSIFQNDEYAKWVLYHHERWDGKGFPRGLKGEEIPYEAHILALCNALDDLFSRYTDAKTVYELLGSMSGTVFDPQLLQKVSLLTIETISGRLSGLFPDENRLDSVSKEFLSEPTHNLGEYSFIRYTPNAPLVELKESPFRDQAVFIAEQVRRTQTSAYENLSDGQIAHNFYFMPYGDEVILFKQEVTHLMKFRANATREILASYRDVIRTLTDEKVLLCTNDEEIYANLGEAHGTIAIASAEDVPKSRDFVTDFMKHFDTVQSSMRIKLAVSEAATNLIKHACDGKLSVYTKQDTVQVLLEDGGSGIPLHELPKTILVSGYSSKVSLGKGFSIMRKATDRILVQTSSKGTKLLLEFSYTKRVASNDHK